VIERAWILNLDAEDEVFRPATYPGPYGALASRPDLAAKLGGLISQGDTVLRPDSRVPGAIGHSWCPTPRAVDALRRAGASPAPAPALDVLRTVLCRGFGAVVGLTLEGAVWTDDVTVALDRVASAAPEGRWLLRRPWGFAGRGRLIATAGVATQAARTFIERATTDGGVLVEPWVRRTLDVSLHGWLSDDGELTAGEPCVSLVNEGGVWSGSRQATLAELTDEERQALDQALRTAAAALRDAGYFGPFGIDAFRYADADQLRFNPRCEINARYCMGWATGMGQRRPDLTRE
jgi:hypothetical protein